MIMITPAEFEDEMKKYAETKDKDAAITLMCNALIDNGYGAGVEVLAKMLGGEVK